MNVYPTAEQTATTRIPVVLTVKDAVHKIKEECPGTAITENYLRQLIKDGILPELKAGNKVLINLDVLIEYLSNPTAEKFQPKAKVCALPEKIDKKRRQKAE